MNDFLIDVPQAELDDLQLRLAGTRWPTVVEGTGWSRGTDADYLRLLLEYWRDHYDWRVHEAALNRLPHVMTSVDGAALHAVHQPSSSADATPLLLLHGWPDSFLRFSKVLPLLDDFHVVVPSIPGYGFSEQPTTVGRSIRSVMADQMAELMARFGYDRFIVSGGDIGTGIADMLGRRHPHRLRGIHLTDLPFRRLQNVNPEELTEDERDYVRRGQEWSAAEGAYQQMQSTKPMTAAFGLNDSPVGLAAWIVEKLRAWSDCHGDIGARFTMDEVVTFLMIYWVTGTIGSSFGPYVERDPADTATDRIDVPTAVSVFPADLVPPSRDTGERLFDLRRWTRMPRGGHFGAFEEPELFADELRAFAATV